MFVRVAVETDLEAMVTLAVSQQAVVEHHIGYLGLEVDSIQKDIVGVDGWIGRTAVAIDDDQRLTGWLLGEKDDDMDRVWWWGPFLTEEAWQMQPDALYRMASKLVGGAEEEMAPDDRNADVAELAERNGFRGEVASAVLSYADAGFGRPTGVVPMEREHRGDVAALHDRLFSGTHTPGASLVESEDLRLVIVVAGEIVGYVAAEVQSDGSGYIDYLGVDPSHRRSGLGRRLVMGATDRLLGLGAKSVNLTVREDNEAARALYESLGFTQERLLRPYRKGFSLDS